MDVLEPGLVADDVRLDLRAGGDDRWIEAVVLGPP
jgi:hypothetical protein